MGIFQVWVDGVRVIERAGENGWGIWYPLEVYLSEGLHQVEFVHLNDGSGGGIIAIDEVAFAAASTIFGDEANKRVCADMQHYVANTRVTGFTKVEPDIDAFIFSKVEPWPAEGDTEANNEPLTFHQIIARDPTDSFDQLVGCKVKHAQGLNVIIQPGIAAEPERNCREINQQLLNDVVASLTPTELAGIPVDGTGALILPIIDADKGSFASEWVYDTAYTGTDGRTHVQAKQLKVPWVTPPGFPVAPNFKGVHYCHLITADYMKYVALGGTPIDNPPAGRE